MNYKAYLLPSPVLERNNLGREAGNLNESRAHGMQGTIYQKKKKKGEYLALINVTHRGGEKESVLRRSLHLGLMHDKFSCYLAWNHSGCQEEIE